MATITTSPAGKFRAQVRRSGVYKAKTFMRKVDANALIVDNERAIEGGSAAGTVRASRDMTPGHIIHAYLKQEKVGRTVQFNLERIKARRRQFGKNGV